MRIENLSKQLDSQIMTALRGGASLVGQVVPTNIQSNEMVQNFNIDSKGPVAIGNSATQSNRSSQFSFVPVGSLLATIPSYGSDEDRLMPA
jgi:hypothetical protein